MKHTLDELTALGLNRVGDFHAPSRTQLGNLKDNGSSIFRQLGTGDSGRSLIVVVGAMLCTLFLTRYMMPILYSYFPAPRGEQGGAASEHLVEGTNYSAKFLEGFPEEE